MPTYLCTYRRDGLSEPQKARIAEAITRAHSEETGAPASFVQVVFSAQSASDAFVGGAPAPAGQMWIRGDIRAGRTEVQKRALMLRIMRAVGGITGTAESEIWVYLCDLTPTDMVEFGRVLPLPGAEEAWLAALPQHLRDRLSGLGVPDSFTL